MYFVIIYDASLCGLYSPCAFLGLLPQFIAIKTHMESLGYVLWVCL